ncbi:Nucleic-acid-binding protein from mobile element jockey [Ooceraea biroi]|uniref:Nucleic-acid-binding protein from mobile element jockey n=1 Tax=Ooceraea biroi TaxID=2015173 RepID=A0A026WL70_OOCBI|nr:Nucleic-acid-binding protein from mobile element jockey [Ooceraea biroi]
MLTLSDFRKAKEILNLVCACYYTYTPKKEKVITVLLKGIHHSYEPDDILANLQSYVQLNNIDNLRFLKVARFKTKRSVSENRHLSIYIVQLDATSQLRNLQKLDRLYHHVITWERLKSTEIIQCKRCQRLGHVASNCKMQFRCVKCDIKHDPGKCSLVTDGSIDKTKLFCANCKGYGHPASYRGCPVLVAMTKKIEDKKVELREKRERKTAHIHAYVQRNVSFADAARNKQSATNINKHRQATTNTIPNANWCDSASSPPLSSFTETFTNMFQNFQKQVMDKLNHFDEKTNDLLTRVQNNEKKTNYILDIIDSLQHR